MTGTAQMCFFFKAPKSTGELCKILGVHADRTQCRQNYSGSLGTRHTAALTPQYTHARYSTRGNPGSSDARTQDRLPPHPGC